MSQLFGTLPAGEVIPRWRVGKTRLMVGGPVLSDLEWSQLEAVGVTHCISVTNPPDTGVPASVAYQRHVEDDGTHFPEQILDEVAEFAASALAAGGLLYVHCWIGHSRSPSFAYAILRSVMGMTAPEALAEIRAGFPWRDVFGDNPKHISYLQGIDTWLAKRASR